MLSGAASSLALVQKKSQHQSAKETLCMLLNYRAAAYLHRSAYHPTLSVMNAWLKVSSHLKHHTKYEFLFWCLDSFYSSCILICQQYDSEAQWQIKANVTICLSLDLFLIPWQNVFHEGVNETRCNLHFPSSTLH